MSKLIPYFIKLLYLILIIYLLNYFLLGVTLSLDFLTKINKICIVNFVLVIAVILKLLLNITTFLNFKKVEQFGWIKTFIFTAAIDLFILIIPFAVTATSSLSEFLNNDKIFDQALLNIKGIYNSDYSSLTPIQSAFFKSLFAYIIIVLMIVIHFLSKYKKHSKIT